MSAAPLPVAMVARLALALRAEDAPLMLLVLASISTVIILIFYWLRLRKLRTAVTWNLTYLEKSETWLADIIRLSMKIIISVDETQRIIPFNFVTETLFGCSAHRAIGRLLSDLIPERFHSMHKTHVRRFGVTGVSECQMGKQRPPFVLHIDGREFPIEASISQIEANDGKFFTVMLHDTMERVRTEATLRRFQEELQHLSGSILATCEEERYRIARELYDDLGQRLSTFKMDISLLTADLQATRNDKTLTDQTQAVQHVIDETIVAVRRISTDLRPPPLDELELVPSLEWMVKDFRQRFGLIMTMHAQKSAMDKRAVILMFRIVQEALDSVVHHADATRVEIKFSQQDGVLGLSIQDNGHGWSGAPPVTGEREPLELLGIRECARLLGGQTTITHAPGSGFRLSVGFSATHKATEEAPS